MAADITITDPEIIVQPAVGDSQIEVLTNNVVNIINDLASGLATGSLSTGPGEPDQEFRVQYAYEAERALKLVGKFRREASGVLEGNIDTNDGPINASDFDALITARIKEYISKITINDGSGFEAGRNSDPNAPKIAIPQDANTIVNAQLRKDLLGYYKEQILSWVSDVFMNGEGVKAGVDSLKELIDFLNDPTNANASNLLNRVTSLETRATNAEDRLTALDHVKTGPTDTIPDGRVTLIEKNIGSVTEYATAADSPAQHTGLTVRESIAKEIRDRKTADELIHTEIGSDSDASDANTLRGNHAELKRQFLTEKTNSDANDALIAQHLQTYKTQITAVNSQISQIGTVVSFTNAKNQIAEVKSSIITKFKNAALNR